MEYTETISIRDITGIIKRRRKGLIISFCAVFLLSLIVAYVWPPVYRSSATILIEAQEIPREYVMTTVTSYAEHRMQVINQRILSSANLMSIITRFNLYADKRKRSTTEEIINDMRENDIKLETITAGVIDPRSGSSKNATIAFTLSYEGENPQMVQQVTNYLVSLYLEENIKVTGQQAAGTTKFLEDELTIVRTRLEELEKAIAAYKERNPQSLPELFQFNLQSLEWNERNYLEMQDYLQTLREKESSLVSQLSAIAPDTANQDKERLKELRVSLVSLQTRFSEKYPDVIKMKAEIAELEKKLRSAENQPEIAGKPDNPSYVALASQLASIRSDIESAHRQLEDLEKRKKDYRQRLERSPRVEEGYKKLLIERDNTQMKYNDLIKKVMESKVAHGLEKEQMGERFTLIDPPRLPEKPVRPNRAGILLIGVMLAIGAGAGTASLREVTDPAVRKAQTLSSTFGFPVLAEIPEVASKDDEQTRRNRKIVILGAVIVCIAFFVLVIHFFVMDLDILWARIIRRLG